MDWIPETPVSDQFGQKISWVVKTQQGSTVSHTKTDVVSPAVLQEIT